MNRTNIELNDQGNNIEVIEDNGQTNTDEKK